MPGILQITKGGPRTYSPASGQTVRGGRAVEFTGSAGRIKEAAAGSLRFAGVALTDCIAPEDLNLATPTVDAFGRQTISSAAYPTSVACAYAGDEVPVVYSANANQGDYLVLTANGTFAPAGATPDARTLVARCTQPGGVVVGTNPVGRARLGI